MNIGYFEDAGFKRLLPLTWLRPCFDLRCGRDRLIDKVRQHVGPKLAGMWIRPALQGVAGERFPLEAPDAGADWCLLNARALVVGDLKPPPPGVAWRHGGELVAAGVRGSDMAALAPEIFLDAERLEGWLKRFGSESVPDQVRLVGYPWELALWNEAELQRQLRNGGVHRGRVYPGVHMMHPAEIHVAAGARVKPGVVLDPEHGPICIDRDALIEPNAVLQGPCYVGPGSIIRPGAVLRGGTSIGPVCKVGGEIEASIFHGHSNKQHDGFLGHSYVAEWVNLGADTVTSDLKNTYGAIRVFLNGVGVESGQHFIGSIISDHSKTGIGTILPTGCVIGVAANVFTQGPVPKFVPSFAWLTDAGMTAYRVEKAVQIARVVMERRDVELSEAQRHLLEQTATAAREVEAAGWAL